MTEIGAVPLMAENSVRLQVVEEAMEKLCDDAEKVDDMIKDIFSVKMGELKSLEAALVDKVGLFRGKSLKHLVLFEQNCIVFRRNELLVKKVMNQTQGVSQVYATQKYMVLVRLKAVLDDSITKQVPLPVPLIIQKIPHFAPSLRDQIMHNTVRYGFFPINDYHPLPTNVKLSTKTSANPISFSSPHGASVDSTTGNLYVADQCNHRVLVISPELTLLHVIGEEKTPRNKLGNVSGVSVCPVTGNVIIVEYDINFVHMFDSSFSYIKMVADVGNAPGKVQGPINVAHDMNGNFYVNEDKNHRIQKFLPDGMPCLIWADKPATKLRKSFSVAVNDANHILVSLASGKEVYVFSDMGDLLRTIPVFETSYNSVCRGPRGGFLLGDYTYNRIHFYDETGKKYHELKVDKPLGITYGLSGELFVVNHTPGALLLCG